MESKDRIQRKIEKVEERIAEFEDRKEKLERDLQKLRDEKLKEGSQNTGNPTLLKG